MKLRDALHTATLGLRHAKVRSLLTMLGIVIGISSVIILMSIGASAQNLILSQVQGIGSNLIFIIPGGSNGSRFSPPASAQGIIIKTLVQQNIDALRREPAVKKLAPQVSGQARVVYGNNDATVSYLGTTADFFPIRNFKTDQGSPFTASDVESFNHVAVIGSALAKTLFGSVAPIGKLIRIKENSFRVIGILEKKGLGPFGVDQDNLVVLPLTVAQKQLLGIDYFNAITIEASDDYSIEYTKSRVTSIMREEHHSTDPVKDDFTIRTQEDALSLLGNITSIMTVFLTAIACISLIVGGIGIMNIMLVSVVERTKEIGLRKAVGATNWDIRQQFLYEAIIITLLGGFVGIAIGALFVVAIYFVLSQVLTSGWTFILPLSAILLAVGVSSITGVVFGLYPASQAAKKNPIEALRYE